jgi:FlaG/FlaF family flagellin (archaellin)
MRVVLLTLVVGCTSSASYGPPTAQTEIELSEDGGFAGPANSQSVHLVGTNVVFGSGQSTSNAIVSTDNVAEIIHTLEGIDFLDIHGDYTTCALPATDASTATFHVTLEAGANSVSAYLGCSGGTFDDLDTARGKIFDLTGYTAWRTGS